MFSTKQIKTSIQYLLLFLFLNLSEETNADEKLLDKLLPKDYNHEIAPKINGSAVDVNVSMSILNVMPETDIKMKVFPEQAFNVDLFLHLIWDDHRIRAVDGMPENITLDHEWKNRLWIPDTYFRNTISGGVANDGFSPSYYLVVRNQTNVFLGARLRLKIGCNMKFHKYPFDRQLCFMNFTTLSQSLSSVRLNWKSFKVGSHVELPEYVIIKEIKGSYVKSYSIGDFSGLYVAIYFKRNVGNFLIKRFIPSFMIVSMSFVGFWIPTSIAPARVSLIITALLALIAQQIQSELNVSYVYALQVWTILSIVFVFATLLEYAMALSLSLCEQSSQPQDMEGQTKIKYCFLRPTPRNCIIDVVSRIVFPICYIFVVMIFVLIYYNMDSN